MLSCPRKALLWLASKTIPFGFWYDKKVIVRTENPKASESQSNLTVRAWQVMSCSACWEASLFIKKTAMLVLSPGCKCNGFSGSTAAPFVVNRRSSYVRYGIIALSPICLFACNRAQTEYHGFLLDGDVRRTKSLLGTRFETRSDAMPPLDHTDTGRSPKRQKTRKGTRSCWACKRRKMKCTYARPADDVCIGCARRCLDCISQEFPDQDPGPSSNSRMVGVRIGRLESTIQQLAEQVHGRASVASSSVPSTPANIGMPVPPSMTHAKHRTLSQQLLAAYPSLADLCIVNSTCESHSLYSRLLQELQEGVLPESVNLWGEHRQQYTAAAHPVLIARQMLLLAGVLQHMPTARYQQLGGLSQPPRVLARRLAEAATTLVTAHDRFTAGTLEGLYCLCLEAVYHEHNGSLCASWLACRRAISAVHLLGFRGYRHSPTALPRSILPETRGAEADLQQIWFHLAHRELALCLALGLPSSAPCPPLRLRHIQSQQRTIAHVQDSSRGSTPY